MARNWRFGASLESPERLWRNFGIWKGSPTQDRNPKFPYAIALGLTESEAVLSEGQFGEEHFKANIGGRCIKPGGNQGDLRRPAVWPTPPACPDV